jgi:murein DD-endopeptidase MepM/ murein hydrolase activator NlpD
VVYIVVLVVLGFTTASVAQTGGGIFPPRPTPQPSDEPEPSLTPAPKTPTPKPDPEPSDEPEPVPSGVPEIPTPSPSPGATPEGGADPAADKEIEAGALPPELEAQQNFHYPAIARTGPRNTFSLVRMLEPLMESGLPRAQVLLEGFGRFPVAGLASYSDDWLNPRFTPTPHLHHGLDIFADFGTPIRAPDKGFVSALSDGPTGGIGVWMRGTDGTAYYFAHLLERVEGIHVGQRVEVGTVLGFVGDTGNAAGGTPHLHFEIHPGGGQAIPPKPSVDSWLDEAERLAPQFVAARTREIEGKQDILAGASGAGLTGQVHTDLEASMLLTLLDPVGGSVGLLPQLQLSLSDRPAVSDRLLSEVIKQRLDGYLFVPESQRLRHVD